MATLTNSFSKNEPFYEGEIGLIRLDEDLIFLCKKNSLF